MRRGLGESRDRCSEGRKKVRMGDTREGRKVPSRRKEGNCGGKGLMMSSRGQGQKEWNGTDQGGKGATGKYERAQ